MKDITLILEHDMCPKYNRKLTKTYEEDKNKVAYRCLPCNVYYLSLIVADDIDLKSVTEVTPTTAEPETHGTLPGMKSDPSIVSCHLRNTESNECKVSGTECHYIGKGIHNLILPPYDLCDHIKSLKGIKSLREVSRIDHPDHYNIGKFEVIAVIDDWKLGFSLGNAIKYIARAEHKDKKLEDLKKAQWYLNHEIQKIEDEKGNNHA